MSQEEKAKAYDEALKRAKAAIDVAADKDLVGGVVRTIFPELRESEDERLRKLLVWQVHRNIEDETNDLKGSVYDGIKGHDPDLEESIEDWKKCLAYLEKQKDSNDMAFHEGYTLGFEDGMKEQKPNVEICPHSIKSKSYSVTGYPIEDCDYGLEIALDILEKTLGKVQGFQTDDGIREHQTAIKAVKDAMEEQKPVDDPLDDPKFLKGFDTGREVQRIFDEQKPAECISDSVKFEEGFKTGRELGFREGVKSVKPSEWNANDKAFIKDCARILDENYYTESAERLLSMFPVKPVEWSEEDERILKGIIGKIDHDQTYGVAKVEMLSFLKSLRPSWKPSEQ